MIDAVLAPVAVQVAAPRPALHFAPPLNRPLTIRVTEIRDFDGKRRRFAARRRVVFRRDGGGLVADVLFLSATAEGDDPASRRFLQSARMLDGLIVRLRLAADGSVTAVDREAEVWAAASASFARAARGAPVPGLDLAGLPSAARRAMLASLVRPLVEAAPPAPGSRRVVLPPAGMGAGVPLAGLETTTRLPGGELSVAVSARGGDAVLERTRLLDPRTGLVRQTTERVRTTVAGRVSESRSETVIETPGI